MLRDEIFVVETKIKDYHSFAKEIEAQENLKNRVHSDMSSDEMETSNGEASRKELKKMHKMLKDKYHAVHVRVQELEQKVCLLTS